LALAKVQKHFCTKKWARKMLMKLTTELPTDGIMALNLTSNFDLETIFQIMKESMIPQHILHFDSTEIRIVKSFQFINYPLPSEELVGYPLVKASNSSGSFRYYVNHEPLIPLCSFQQIWGYDNSTLFADVYCNQVSISTICFYIAYVNKNSLSLNLY